MAIPLLKPWFNSQPGWEAPIDRAHPIGKLITRATAAHYHWNQIEMVTGEHAVYCNAAASQQSVREIAPNVGKATSGAPGSSLGHYFNPSPMWGSGGIAHCTVEILFTGKGAMNQFDRMADFGSNGGWGLESGGSLQMNLVAWYFGGYFTINLGTTIMTAGRTHHVVFTYDYINWLFDIWVDGVKTQSAIYTNMTQAGRSNFNFHSYQNSGANSGAADVHFLRSYQGVMLRGDQIKSLAANPWQVYDAGVGVRVPALVAATPAALSPPPLIAQQAVKRASSY